MVSEFDVLSLISLWWRLGKPTETRNLIGNPEFATEETGHQKDVYHCNEGHAAV